MVLLKFSIAIIFTMAISYLLGSLSFSVIFTKKLHNVDIRTKGSGNAGFTNVYRAASKKAAFLTFICDFLKGILSALIGKLVFLNLIADGGKDSFILAQLGVFLAGICCIIGHIFPCFFKFKGGKGVLTTSAIILIADYRVFVAIIIVFAIVLLISKIVSLSSICAAISLPIFNFLITFFIDFRIYDPLNQMGTLNYVFISTILTAFMGLVVIYLHKSNIERIKNGTEKKIR